MMKKPDPFQFGSEWAFHKGVALRRELAEKLKREETIGDDQEVKLREQRGRSNDSDESDEFGDVEPDDAEKTWKQPLASCSSPAVKIFDRNSVDDLQSNVNARISNNDDRRRAYALLDKLREKGELRKLVQIPDDWATMFDRLNKMFPNFSEVIEYLRCMCLLASHGDHVVRFTPILLNGPAGLGKTLFAEQLARELGMGFVCIRMENAQSNSALSGSSEFWSNSQPGRIFNWLVEKDDANPIVVLDEIDKVAGDLKYDPLSSLYSLFEPMTAKTFADLANPWLTLDASHIGWICTSNEADVLPEPILSRVKRFDIAQPTLRAARRLALQMFYKMRTELPPVLQDVRLSRGSLDKLAKLSPRSIRKVLPELVIGTFARGSRRVAANHVESDSGNEKKGPIGFLSG
jgi:ATP-dependent Lon protease